MEITTPTAKHVAIMYVITKMSSRLAAAMLEVSLYQHGQMGSSSSSNTAAHPSQPVDKCTKRPRAGLIIPLLTSSSNNTPIQKDGNPCILNRLVRPARPSAPSKLVPVRGRLGIIGVYLFVFVRDPYVDDFLTSTGGFGGGPGSKYTRLPESTMMSILDIFCFFERRFSLQNRKPRIPRTNAPSGMPIANPIIVAMFSGVSNFADELLDEDVWLAAEGD